MKLARAQRWACMLSTLGCDSGRQTHIAGEIPFRWLRDASLIPMVLVLFVFSFLMRTLTRVLPRFVAVVSSREPIGKALMAEVFDRAAEDPVRVVTVQVVP